MHTRRLSSGILRDSINCMKFLESLMYDCCCCAIGCNRWSTYCDMDSVGPSQPDTIGRIPGGVLCIFSRSTFVVFLGL